MSITSVLNESDVSDFLSFHVQFDGEINDMIDPVCNECTLKQGTFLGPNFSLFGVRLNENETNSENERFCPQGFQCVGESEDDTHGCCQACNDKQLCTRGSISFGGDDAGSWNLCPPGFLCDSFAEDVFSYINMVSRIMSGNSSELDSQHSHLS